MKNIIIGLSGKKSSGKTSLCNYFQSFLKTPKIYSLAEPLKNFCIDVLGLSYEQCYGTEKIKILIQNILGKN